MKRLRMVFSLSLWGEEFPREHDRSPLPEGEGQGEGENAALVAIPFTLCFLLFYRDRTRERARVAHRHHPGDPGSRQRKSPLRGPFVLCRLTFGSGTSLHPCRLSPPPASLRAAPVSRQRLIDFQPDPAIAVTVSLSLRGVIAVKRHITGDPSALWACL